MFHKGEAALQIIKELDHLERILFSQRYQGGKIGHLHGLVQKVRMEIVTMQLKVCLLLCATCLINKYINKNLLEQLSF